LHPDTRFQLFCLLVLSAAAIVALALLVGVGVSTWQAIVANRALQRAIRAEREREAETEIAEGEREKAVAARAEAEDQRSRADASLYAATMNLAQQAWNENHIARVRHLLEESADHPSRDFEWHFWHRQTHLAQRTLRGHLGGVNAVAFSPADRRLIASAGHDRSVKLWNARTGQELWSRTEHTGPIFSLAFSPDGTELITGSWDHTALVWEVATGRVLRTLEGHRSAVWPVACGTNGLIATGSSDNTAMVWHRDDAQPRLVLRHGARVISVALSSDGRRLATSSRDGTVRVWDAQNGNELQRIPVSSGVFAVSFYPDGTRLLTAHPDQTARVWELSTGKELLALRGHGPGWIIHANVSRDGRRIVTASHDNTAKVWDADTGDELFTVKGHSGWVRWVDLSPDGQFVATASRDQTVKLWALTPERNPSVVRGHTASVRSVAVSRDGQWLVTGSEDQTAVIWAARSGARQFVLTGHVNWVSAVALAPEGERVATGSDDHTVKIWSAIDGRELSTLEGHRGAVCAVAFSPDGQRLVTGSVDRSAILWDLSKGARTLTFDEHSGPIWTVAFSPDGERILTGSEDGRVIVWDAIQGRALERLPAHQDPVRVVAWSPDGSRFLTASVDGTAIVWDAATVTNSVLVLESRGGPHAGYHLSGERNIWSAAFSPNARRIVTGGDDGVVRVWDASSGLELLAIEGPAEAVLSVAFSPDGRSIFAGSADRGVWTWEVASPDQVAAWQAEEQRHDEHLAALQREENARVWREREERSRDPGAIKDWLILGPIRWEVRPEHEDNSTHGMNTSGNILLTGASGCFGGRLLPLFAEECWRSITPSSPCGWRICLRSSLTPPISMPSRPLGCTFNSSRRGVEAAFQRRAEADAMNASSSPSTTAVRCGLALAGWLLLCFAAAALGAVFVPGEWYAALRKPSWNPPGWIFGPVWTTLYTMMAVAAWLVWRQGGWGMRRKPLLIFVAQLALNALWTPLFFGLHRPGVAFAGIVLLWLAIATTLAAFWPVSRLAAWLLAPYLAWVSFAAALNFTLWRLNS
jgi:WD40 repeat protein/tryptophan-rich sensory protein